MRYVIRPITKPGCFEDNCRKDATHRIWADGGEFGDYCHEHAVAKVENLERYQQAVEYANRSQSLKVGEASCTSIQAIRPRQQPSDGTAK